MRIVFRRIECQYEGGTPRRAALRLQFHPHFLFNAINAVAMLIRQGAADDAVRSLTTLSEILRHFVAAPDAQEVLLPDARGLTRRAIQCRFSGSSDSSDGWPPDWRAV
jgi:hypothetical protein